MFVYFVNSVLVSLHLPEYYEFNLGRMALDEYNRRLFQGEETAESFRIVMLVLYDQSMNIPLHTLTTYKQRLLETLRNIPESVSRIHEVTRIIQQIDRLLRMPLA